MSSETNRRVLARHVEAENAHDMEGTLATLHPECLFDEVPLGRVHHGREGAREHYAFWWTTFGLQFTHSSANHWTTDGRLIAEGTFRGRHRGHFLGLEPTGTLVEYPFLVIVEFRDALLASERFYFDVRTIVEQIRNGQREPELREG